MAERVGVLDVRGVETVVSLDRSSINCRFEGELDLLHVMSAAAGGQIRGYKRPRGSRGPWRVCRPAYEGNWVAVDIAVSQLLRAPVRGVDGIVRVAA